MLKYFHTCPASTSNEALDDPSKLKRKIKYLKKNKDLTVKIATSTGCANYGFNLHQYT